MKRVIPARSKRSGTRAGGLSSVASTMALPDPCELDPTIASDRNEEVEGIDSMPGLEDMIEKTESAIFQAPKENAARMSRQANLHSKSLKFAKFRGSTSDKGTWKKLRKSFIEEMRQLSKLRHPCICTVMGAVIGKSAEPMLVMEYMDHGSLNDLLKNDTIVIDGEVILPILRDISQGLRFLHSANPQVIHGGTFYQSLSITDDFSIAVLTIVSR